MSDHLDIDESRLDAGLEAAFGQPGPVAVSGPSAGGSVIAELRERMGGDTRVHLRSEEGGGDGTPTVHDGADRYEMLGEIARGGMGVIIRGHDHDLGRDVAMKVLQPRHAHNPAMVQRFVEEAQIAGQLQHPGVLQVYELGLQADRRPYFTMKLIKGRTLADLLAERSGPDVDRRRFLGIFEKVCQTMAYTHSRGVLHRDLKPANIMVGNFGEVQIVDWGLAKVLSREEKPAEDSTTTIVRRETVIKVPRADDSGSHSIAGSVMGTPAYMPPEQARGEVSMIDQRSDVFSLGAILCEILTGRPPYTGKSADILEDAKSGHLDDARNRLAGCGADDELVKLAEDCLATRRRDRIEDGQAVADRITGYLTSLEERARTAELEAVEARAKVAHAQRVRRRTIVMAASILVAIVLGASGIMMSQNERIRTQMANSEELNRQLTELMASMEEARETPVSDEKSWIALRAVGAHVAALHGALDLDTETRERATAILDEFDQADRDRRVVERIEEAVIRHATHKDSISWLTMEMELRDTFRDYGIDLDTLSQDDVRARILDSTIGPQLTDGLELWVATVGGLTVMGAPLKTREEMMAWIEILFEADPHPYRVAVRQETWKIETGPDPAMLQVLAASDQFEEAPPRTLAWLGEAMGRAGDDAGMDDVFRRAIMLYPTDFMLNFDYAYSLASKGRWEEAIRYYDRALAIRPEIAGMRRTMGTALRDRTDSPDLEGALEQLREAVAYQADHPPTWVDLGLTLEALGEDVEAEAAYRQALELDPTYIDALCALGRLTGELPDSGCENETGEEPEPPGGT